MAYYDKKLGVYLPEKPIKPIKLEKPNKIDPVIAELIKEEEKHITDENVLDPIENPMPLSPSVFTSEEIAIQIVEKKEEIEDALIEMGNHEPPKPIELTPEEKKAIRIKEIREELAKMEPYHYEEDEDGIEWWICNICKKAYNSETVQKRHQTLKHK